MKVDPFPFILRTFPLDGAFGVATKGIEIANHAVVAKSRFNPALCLRCECT
jgi:hypothetical protein